MNDEVNPFSSPPEVDRDAESSVQSGQVPWAVPYEPARLRARLSMMILSVIVVIDIVGVLLTYQRIDLLEAMVILETACTSPHADMVEGISNEFAANCRWCDVLGWIATGFGLASPILFLMWFHRVYRNLPSLGAIRVRFSPRSAVAWWFAPVFNLFRPCQAMLDIWNGSDPTVVENGQITDRRGLWPTAVACWWGLWMIRCVVGGVAGVLGPQGNPQATTGEWITFLWLLIVSNGLRVLSAFVTIAMIRRTTANQEKRIRLIGVVEPMGNGPGIGVD